MMLEKKDLRVEKSKKCIKEAFVNLVAQRGYERVTIKDVAEYAMVNRKTFYYHYTGKEELYKEIANDLLRALLIKKNAKSDLPTIKASLTYLLTQANIHKRTFEIFLHDEKNNIFMTVLKEFIIQHFYKRTEELGLMQNLPVAPPELIQGIVGATGISILTWWITQDVYDVDAATDVLLAFLVPKASALSKINLLPSI